MRNIYFVSEQHEKNFKETLLKWPNASTNDEYKSACYILSVPVIYEKVEELVQEFQYPVDWIWKWEIAYNSDLRESLDITEKRAPGYDLTGSMVSLGRLALNLWNSYEHFNLMHCISRVDEDNYNVALCAIDIRMNKALLLL